MAAWRPCFDDGVYTNPVADPAVPRGRGVLRLTVMATPAGEQLHEGAQIVAAAVPRVRDGERELA